MFGCHRLDSRLIFADFLVANGFRMIFSDDTQGAKMKMQIKIKMNMMKVRMKMKMKMNIKMR